MGVHTLRIPKSVWEIAEPAPPWSKRRQIVQWRRASARNEKHNELPTSSSPGQTKTASNSRDHIATRLIMIPVRLPNIVRAMPMMKETLGLAVAATRRRFEFCSSSFVEFHSS
jgi:hypothetical protein